MTSCEGRVSSVQLRFVTPLAPLAGLLMGLVPDVLRDDGGRATKQILGSFQGLGNGR